MTTETAQAAGYAHALRWIGPNGTGDFGNLGAQFIIDMAEQYACGRPCHELTDGPTADEQAAKDAYLDGFWNGRESQTVGP
jgi:hypothetical protein